MQIKKIGISNSLGILVNAWRLFRRNLGTLLTASLLSLITYYLFSNGFRLLLIYVLGPEAIIYLKALSLFQVLFFLTGLVLLPPLAVGWFELCRKLAYAEPASAISVFAPYRHVGQWLKAVVYCLLSILFIGATNAVYVLAVGQTGIDITAALTAFLRADMATMAGMSLGSQIAIGIALLLGTVQQSMLMLGFCQVALTESTSIGALKNGIAGTLKNLFSVLLLLLVFIIGVVLASIITGILAGFAIGLLGSLSKTLGYAIGIVLYVMTLMLIYPLLFSFQYYLWQGILGNDAADGIRISDSDLSA